MTKISTFGVGCFHFGILVDVPYKFRMARYAQRIEEFLRSIETISEFAVEVDQHEEYNLKIQPLSMNEGDIFPIEGIFAVSFSLRIPYRTQVDIMKMIRGPEYSWSDAGTEQFIVRTEYSYHGPVTIIECIEVDDPNDCEPSEAVVIVREYLKKKMEEYDSRLRFELIGPSPFHANLFVVEDKSIHKTFTVDHEPREGYDRVTFGVSPNAFRNRMAFLFEILRTPLSSFYSLQRIRSERIRAWKEIETVWRDVCGESRQSSIFPKLQRSIGRRKNIAALVRHIMTFRAEAVFNNRIARTHMKHVSGKDCPRFVRKSVEEAITDTVSEYPTTEMLELARFHEDRGAKWLDRVSVFVAAVTGGIIGAIITLLSSSA